jgi:hypothetical protein
MDDILIFLKTLEENQKQTCHVLERIHRETQKCTFYTQEVNYLGMMICPG